MMKCFAGVIKKGAVFYLCLCVLTFGVMCACPSTSEARMIEKSAAAGQVDTQTKDASNSINPELENMQAGEAKAWIPLALATFALVLAIGMWL